MDKNSVLVPCYLKNESLTSRISYLQDKVGDEEYGELNTDMRVELHFMRQ